MTLRFLPVSNSDYFYLIIYYQTHKAMLQNKPGAYKKFLLRRYLQALVFICLSYTGWPQQRQLNYEVVQNGTNIGWLKLQKNDSAGTSIIRFDSEVKKRILFLFSIIEKQEVLFQKGLMI